MQASYAVTWQEGAEPVQRGKLELRPTALVLEGSDGAGPKGSVVAYAEMTNVQVARTQGDRLAGRQTLLVDRRSAKALKIAGVAQPGMISELAERLTGLRTGERPHVSRLVIVVPLQQGAVEQARAMLRKGPPFDPEAADGLSRHHVFLTDEEAVFAFEVDAPGALERLASDPTLWDALAGWNDLVSGPPRMAENIYSWVRPNQSEEVSFASTPGPGDSEGGDVFAP
jgi:hypothetical protein